MENIMEVDLKIEGKLVFSELMDSVTKELQGKYNREKDILKLKNYSKKGNRIHLTYEVIEDGAVRSKKEFSSPYKEFGGRLRVFG